MELKPDVIEELKKRQGGQAGSQPPRRELPPAPLQIPSPVPRPQSMSVPSPQNFSTFQAPLAVSTPHTARPLPAPRPQSVSVSNSSGALQFQVPQIPKNTGHVLSTPTPAPVNSHDSLNLQEEFQKKFLRKDVVEHLKGAISDFIKNPNKETQNRFINCLSSMRILIGNDLDYLEIKLDYREVMLVVSGILQKIVRQITDLKIQDIQHFNLLTEKLEMDGGRVDPLPATIRSLLEQIRLRFPLSSDQQSVFDKLKETIRTTEQQDTQDKKECGLGNLLAKVNDFFENRLFLDQEKTAELIAALEKAGIPLPEYFSVGLPKLQQTKVDPCDLSLYYTNKSEQFLVAHLLYSAIGLDEDFEKEKKALPKVLPKISLDAEGILYITIFSESLKNRKQEASKAIQQKQKSAANFSEIFGLPGKNFCFDSSGNIEFSFRSAHEANAFFESFGILKNVDTEKLYRELCPNHFDLSEIVKKHELWEAFKAFKTTFKENQVNQVNRELEQRFQAAFFQAHDKLMKQLEYAITAFTQEPQSVLCQRALVECLSALNKKICDLKISGAEEFVPIFDAIFDVMINNIKGLKGGHIQSMNLLMNNVMQEDYGKPAIMLNTLLNKMHLRFPLSKEHQKAHDEIEKEVLKRQETAKTEGRNADVMALNKFLWEVRDYFQNRLFGDSEKSQALAVHLITVGILAPEWLQETLYKCVLTLSELEKSRSESIIELKELGWFFLVFNSDGAKFKRDANRVSVSGEESSNTKKYALAHTQKSTSLCHSAITKNINSKNKSFFVIHKNDSIHVAINEISASQATYSNVCCIANINHKENNKLFSIPGHVQAVSEMTGKYELQLIFFGNPMPSDEVIRLNPSKLYLYFNKGSLFYAVYNSETSKVDRICIDQKLSAEDNQRIRKVLENKSILEAGELSDIQDGKSFLAFLQIAEKAGYPILGLKLKEIKTSNTALRDLIFAITGLFGDIKEIDEEILQELVDRAKREESCESLYEWYKEMAKYLLNNSEGCFAKSYNSMFDCNEIVKAFQDEVYAFLMREYKEDLQKRFEEIFQVVRKEAAKAPLEKPVEEPPLPTTLQSRRSLPSPPEEFKSNLSRIVSAQAAQKVGAGAARTGASAVNAVRAFPGAGPLGSSPIKPNDTSNPGVGSASSNTPPPNKQFG